MELIKLLPDYYEHNETMQLLQSILSQKTEQLEDQLSDSISECFITTASAMLARYEAIFGLDINIKKTDAFRIERITAKLSGAGTTTKAMIQDVASRYSNGDVEVFEGNPNSIFTIKFVGMLGIPANMADLRLTIEEIKPAHLAVEYEYVYNTWDDVQKLTWSAAAAYTWDEIRTVGI
ncbi:MAG: putative phage tail protein [Lachnospiraceae bacterium]